MTYKKMGIIVLSLLLCALLTVATITMVFDPFFHYHAPFDWQEYILTNKQRYFNDGIARHFEYDALITGTSMTENFKTSELDELFGVTSIKVSYSGGSFKEINDALTRAVDRQPKLHTVIRGLDLNRFLIDKDEMGYTDYPEYLYDDILFNDVSYLFNKDVLLEDTFYAALNAIKDVPSTTFDEYSNWNASFTFGKDSVLKTYNRPEKTTTLVSFTQEDEAVVRGTVTQNITTLAAANPQIHFYYFLTPYSIVHWDSLFQAGEIQRHLTAQQLAIELMLEYDNIHVFSFTDMFDVVTDLDNYKDTIHYSEDINSQMLQCMKNGEHQITKENCDTYFSSVWNFYTTYSYDQLFAE